MTQVDVCLTDYGVALLCWRLRSGLADRNEACWYRRFFAAVGLSALVGGTVHGFWADKSSLGYSVLWPICLALLGASGLAAYQIGSRISPMLSWVRPTSWALFGAYCLILAFWSDSFVVAIAFCLPAMTFWMAAAVGQSRLAVQTRVEVFLGVSLTFLSAVIQQLKWSLFEHFNHNATAHSVQAVGLYLLYRSARRLTEPDPS